MRPQQNVLIVEDDVSLRQLYRMALTFAGFEVREVGDGYDALQAIEAKRPDLIVLDLALPTVDGRTVREELAANAHTRQIPIVIVTGLSGPEVHQLDADCVLTKPVAPERLVDTVQNCLRNPRSTDARR